MVWLNSHGDGTAWRYGTLRFQRAGFTVFHGEFNLDHLIVVAINGWGPTYALLSRRTPHLLRLPIDLEEAFIKALLGLALPLVIGSGRGDQVDALLLAALDKLFGFGIVGVGEVLCWACLTFPEAGKLEISSSVVRRRPDSGS